MTPVTINDPVIQFIYDYMTERFNKIDGIMGGLPCVEHRVEIEHIKVLHKDQQSIGRDILKWGLGLVTAIALLAAGKWFL